MRTGYERNFPAGYLQTFGLSAKSADDFLTDLIDLNHEKAVNAFRELVFYKRKPPLNEFEMLDILRNNNLINTANYLHSLI